jgi:hypothetical protein
MKKILRNKRTSLMGKKRKKAGREAKPLKIKGDWQSAVNKALKKEKPPKGWPDKEKDIQN